MSGTALSFLLAAVMATWCVFLSCVLYIVFLLSYICSQRSNDSLHHLKEKRIEVIYFLHHYPRFSRQCGHSSEKSSQLLLAHRRKTFLASSLACYPNWVAGFRLISLLSCGDVSPNPGPAPNCNKNLCSVCRRSVAHNHRAIQCDVCLCTLVSHQMW